MSDYMTPDQLRDLYAEIIDKHASGPECDTDVRKLRAYEAVDALAAAGLLPRAGYVRFEVDGQRRGWLAYRTDPQDVPPPPPPPPPPPAPGKGRGPR